MPAMIGFFFSPLGRVVGVALLVLALIGGIYLKGRNAGERDALSSINAINAIAQKDAHDAARNVDGCYDAGGVWSVKDGKCERPARPLGQ